MQVLFWGIVLFWAAFVVHVLVWRIHLPYRQTKTLLQIFFITLLAGLFILWKTQHILPIGMAAPEGVSDYLHISLFVIALTLAYMITYSALEADSPSLVMVLSIARAGKDGLPTEQFRQQMTDEILVLPRIRDLLRDKLVCMEGDIYKLTPKGIWFARIFILYRHVLNIRQKGG